MFCKNCGEKLDDGQKYCPKCGACSDEKPVSNTSPVNNQSQNTVPSGVCCPSCGNTDLQVVNETDIDVKGKGYSSGRGCLGYMLMGPLGLLCGSCGSKQKIETTNTTLFVCPKCGKKFKREQDLRAEKSKLDKFKIIMIVLGVIMVVLSLLSMANARRNESIFYLMTLLFGVFISIGGFLKFYLSGKKVQEQLDEIEAGKQKFLK